MRAPSSTWWPRMLTEKNRASAIARPAKVSRTLFIGLVGLLELDHDAVGEQEAGDQRQEEQHVAPLDHALGDAREVCQEAERGHRLGDRLRGERPHEVEHG